jgi:hypothetical protein
MSRTIHCIRVSLLALTLLALPAAIVALLSGRPAAWAHSTADSTRPWTTVGSAGTVDEADASLASFNGAVVTNGFSGTIYPIGGFTLDLRYNVVAVDELTSTEEFAPSEKVRMTLRYQDNGTSAGLTVSLKCLNCATGTVTTIMTFNSNSYAQSSIFQCRTIDSTCRTRPFDFNQNFYWIEGALNESGSSGLVGLAGIKLELVSC